ncbi:hypothetical protein J7L02_00880 [Candidatus Woesearchaeota archaeon]|nr:hypothetical protein [Candidatus Woesearchaeota archaeon]
MIIAFEGIDGSGKQTQAGLLKHYLEKQSFTVAMYSFPNYDSETGRRLKQALHNGLLSPEQMALLYMKDRLNMAPSIKAFNEKPRSVVIIDRYIHSNVFQAARLDANLEEKLRFLKRFEEKEINAGVPKPDLVLLIDMLPELSKELLKHKHKDILEKDLNFQKIVRSLYLQVFNNRSEFIVKDWVLIKGYEQGSVKPISMIHEEIVNAIKAFKPLL